MQTAGEMLAPMRPSLL